MSINLYEKKEDRLGWIGVGNMGAPMAKRLCEAGYTVTVCGSGRRDLAPYAKETGALLAKDPAELAAKADMIFTMIPDGKVLLSIVEELLQSNLTGKVLVDMSTVDPASSSQAAEKLQQAHAALLRAPVTGSTGFAKKGELGIMVSGDEAVYERCLPYLKILGNRQTYLGQKEEARQMKILINMLLGDEMQALSEALVVGRKLGLPWEKMLDLIADSAAGAPLYGYKKKILKSMDFAPSSTVYNQHKDMKMAAELAAEVGVQTPVAQATMQMYTELMERGMDQLDNIAVYLVNAMHHGEWNPETSKQEEL